MRGTRTEDVPGPRKFLSFKNRKILVLGKAGVQKSRERSKRVAEIGDSRGKERMVSREIFQFGSLCPLWLSSGILNRGKVQEGMNRQFKGLENGKMAQEPEFPGIAQLRGRNYGNGNGHN